MAFDSAGTTGGGTSSRAKRSDVKQNGNVRGQNQKLHPKCYYHKRHRKIARYWYPVRLPRRSTPRSDGPHSEPYKPCLRLRCLRLRSGTEGTLTSQYHLITILFQDKNANSQKKRVRSREIKLIVYIFKFNPIN